VEEQAEVGDMTERSLIPRRFFSKDEIARISEAISRAELNTQGEIRVHIERNTEGNVLEHARAMLKELGLNRKSYRIVNLHLAGRS
jgi:hypothetical protein